MDTALVVSSIKMRITGVWVMAPIMCCCVSLMCRCRCLVFSGNYWWADCEHISALPGYFNLFDSFHIEHFLFNVSAHYGERCLFGENCGYSTYNCKGIDHYEKECPPASYRRHLLDYVSNDALLSNEVSTLRSPRDVVLRSCVSMKQSSYAAQPGWDDWSKFPLKLLN